MNGTIYPTRPTKESEWVQIAQSQGMVNYRGFWCSWRAEGDYTFVYAFKTAQMAVERWGWTDEHGFTFRVKGHNADRIKKELDKAINRFWEKDHQLNHRLRWLLEGTA